MKITVPGMRSNKLVSMDIDQLRGMGRAFMDRAMIVSLIATIMAVAALASRRGCRSGSGGARARLAEQATFDRYKGMESHSVQLEQEWSPRARARGGGGSRQEVSTGARERAVNARTGSLYGAPRRGGGVRTGNP